MKALFLTLTFAAILASAFFTYDAHRRGEITSDYSRKLAPIVEYEELYQSGGDREANDVLLLAVVNLLDAEDASADLEELFRQVEWTNQTPVAYSDLLQERLLHNLKSWLGYPGES